MKKTLLLCLLLCSGKALLAQKIYTIKADSVKITNDCDTAELIIENHTQDIKGFLFNKGKGRTEFRRVTQIDDSTIVVGDDTLIILGRAPVGDNGIGVEGNVIQLGHAYWDQESDLPARFTGNRHIPIASHYLFFRDNAPSTYTGVSSGEFLAHTINGDDLSLTPTSFHIYTNGQGSLEYEDGSLQIVGTESTVSRISVSKHTLGGALVLERTNSQSFLSNSLNSTLWLFNSGNLIIATDTEPTDDGAKFQVKGTGTFTDTLTATTMGNTDSSNRVATTAFVKNNIASPTLNIITAPTSDLTAVIGSLTKLPDLTGAGSHSVTLPSAAAHTGERIYLWNRNSSGNTWAFASSVTLPDGTTTTTIPNQTTIELISDGSTWIKWK